MPLLRRTCRAFLREERAAAMVEFAIVALLLFLLVFGTIDWGRYLFQRTIMVNAVREGARYGAVATAENEADVQTFTRTRLVGLENQAGVTVTPTYCTESSVRFINVNATYTYTPVFPLVMGRQNSKSISVRARFRVEQPSASTTPACTT